MSSAGGASASQAPPSVQDYVVRVPKNQSKKFSIMRFNASMGVDFTKWSQVKMERENNMVQFKSMNEEMPKFGAGSEYGREQREEARRKKFGIISKKYRPEDQPWILQYGGKTGKKFRGVREGGVTENASYYIFTQAADGAFEAFPVEEWYNFQTIQRYKALSIEEAEEEFNNRNRTLNLFNVMVRKRMTKNEDEGDDEEGEGEGKGKGKKKKKGKDDLRISEMDDWMESSSDGSSDGEDKDDDEDRKDKKKNKKGKKIVKKQKRKDGSDDEPIEDSDDGDGEGREVDYISSSSDESDVLEAELKGVAEEDALRRLLNSEEEDEDEEEEMKDKEDENEDEQEDEAGPSKDDKDEKKKKEKKKKKDKKPRKEDYGSSSDSDSDSSVSEAEKSKPSPKMKPASAENSRSGTPTKPVASSSAEPSSDGKRKMSVEPGTSSQQSKKPRLDSAAAASASTSSSSAEKDGVNEESVRRYLSRKPMTTTELLKLLKSKKTGRSSAQLVHDIAQILKKINPVKQTIKGKMYLSIKA